MRDPVTTTCTLTSSAIAVASAKRQPNGWAINDATRLPLAACANAVVIPQVGQGKSATTIHPQRGRFKDSCVPIPLGEGVSQAATNSTASEQPIAMAATSRRHFEDPTTCTRNAEGALTAEIGSVITDIAANTVLGRGS